MYTLYCIVYNAHLIVADDNDRYIIGVNNTNP